MPPTATAPRAARAVDARPHRAVGRTPQARLEDELLALLVTTWAVHTGRRPPERAPHLLTPEELIDFWSDDLTAAPDSSH
ncbi:hypothetical protein Sme01_65440 [Sphaerisporangium melleum]|uniref:Uncharacterized protein n=2 Tax=Sphaerisporangium melleum TaxID=321316 RepID=A0A917REF2_9ACTN|nr:hypothetical protein GCM10007964_51860 [Sphaerisporangium melleum]GII74068.1 hypothetical protein Sme01_65440 [Sphaerisporangium melleum]